ncbi:interferon-induced helicase C domain-containing protein 1 [Cheilinus undulatus]|uniref:interferon-induced helicase C domain-containing protein 1 n=1 Tax=Cheilinus undulatus TaxID=241271 RepID=UPI001BD65C34|nr:interferon-induced helicase C domain-containing protein 1 [Cheilinus undulatus]
MEVQEKRNRKSFTFPTTLSQRFYPVAYKYSRAFRWHLSVLLAVILFSGVVMASDQDDANVYLIRLLTPRLRELIVVHRVLDRIDFLPNVDRERIKQKARTEGNVLAADLLIGAITKKPHSPGWFRAFVDALKNSGFNHAADCIQGKCKPEEEAESDYCVKLIQILSPSLVEMNTKEVCLGCFSKELLSQEDKELIEAKIQTEGPQSGARELLSAIVRGHTQWFSTFLDVLRETEHQYLYELTGGPPDCDKLGSAEKQCSCKDESTGCDVTMEGSPAAAEGSDCTEYMEVCVAETPADEDLCQGVRVEFTSQSESMELSQPDGADSQAAPRGPGREHIVLRDYQMDVARPALEGKNIIVCLPTGSGKTRVAVYITKTHLDGRRAGGRSGKVVVLVNKVPLVEQHYSAEFLPFLKHEYKVERVSGDCQQKISFTEIIKRNDVVICTAQILENYLERSNEGEDEGVNLSDLSLIVIDECHHTQKGEVYNHIMMRYLRQKHKNFRLKKEQKKPVPLPQILGLTASPGVGDATKMKQAEEHILRICANLDASKIMTRGLGEFRKDQRTKIVTVEDRKQDPFGDVIKNIMNAIHVHAGLSPTCELGSQNYEQWVVQKERTAATDEDHKVRVCAEHLRQYNEGLNLSNTIRMRDSFSFLNKYHQEELKRKSPPEEDHIIEITDTERFLFNLFKEKKEELQKLADIPEYENDSLSKLRTNILQEFTSRDKARGIVFTKTRRSAIALTQWVMENPKFADIGVAASYVIGGGDQSVVKPMTAAEQKDVLKKFGSGEINLLIATSVAEEGLDIPQCNIVIQYGQMTNEIGMIQARGRGRAEDSSFIVIEVKNSWVAEKECVNEYRINMMNKAIDKIKALPQAEYNRKIDELQYQSIMEEKVRMTKKRQKDIMNENPSDVKFVCRGCSEPVCTGEDIQVVEKVHRVNVTTEFSKLYIQTENTSLRERLLDYETNGFISCKRCGQRWGSMMMFKGLELPCLHVKNFTVTVNGKKMNKCNKWKDLAVKFTAFDYAEHASRVVESSDDEEM